MTLPVHTEIVATQVSRHVQQPPDRQTLLLSHTTPTLRHMELFLTPNNPQRTVLVSPNGVAHYRVKTSKTSIFGAPGVSRIQRPAETEEDSIVAEIEWKSWGTDTLVRSNLIHGMDDTVRAKDFLYKRGPFSSSRYFLGNDRQEYRWKSINGVGFVLTHNETNEEVARFIQELIADGIFAGERKSCLRIQPCSVDLDLIVLSCLIMEKKRRDHAGDGTKLAAHDEDPQGDGGGGLG